MEDMTTERKLKINFILPPIPKITGGPLAIFEYAERLLQRGHLVTVTTYPDIYWSGEHPFPWATFSGEVRYKSLRGQLGSYQASHVGRAFRLIKFIILCPWSTREMFFRANLIARLFLSFPTLVKLRFRGEQVETGFRDFLAQFFKNVDLIDSIPDCDLNIATWWMTAFPAVMSGKGKPVYFIQHYEEVFYENTSADLFNKIMCRATYDLPIHIVANSSWLQKVVRERHGRDVPFSNNALDITCFRPKPKKSEQDGIFRVITYCRPEAWKGFADAFAIVERVRASSGIKLEWHVFGFEHEELLPSNLTAPYIFHKGLKFSELAELYAECDVALCCSWYESFPLPPLEAMASGTAVLTTAQGTEDYAHHLDTAMVIGSRDVVTGANYLLRLLTDHRLRRELEERGLATAQRYTWDRAVDVRENLLREIARAPEIVSPDSERFFDESGRSYARMPADLEFLDGRTVRGFGSQSVWKIEKGQRFEISPTEDDALEVPTSQLLRVPISDTRLVAEVSENVRRDRRTKKTASMFHNTSLNLFGQVIPILVALFSIPFLIQRLGSDRFGVLMLAWMCLGYFNIFDFGLSRALTKSVAEKLGTEREEEIPVLFWTTVASTAVFGALGAAIMIAISKWLVQSVLKIPAGLEDETYRALLVVGFCLPFVIMTATFRGLLEATQNFYELNRIQVPIGALFYLLPLLFSFISRSMPVVISALMICRLFACGLFLLASLRALPYSPLRARPQFSLLPDLLKFGGWITVANMIIPIISYADRFLIGALLSMAAVTYYSTPYEVVNRMWIIPWALVAAVFPALASQVQHDRNEAARTYVRATKFLFALLTPLTLLIILFSFEGLRIWAGTEIAVHSAAITRILAIAIFINCFGVIPGAMLDALGKPVVAAISHVIQLPLYVGALYYAIPKYGIEGAAAIWILRTGFDTITLFLFANGYFKETKGSVRRGFSIGVSVVILFAILAAAVDQMSMQARILGAFGAFIFYFPWVWFQLLDGADRSRVLELVSSSLRLNRAS